ncbi:6-phosphogluconolactonase [Candidatus Nomurabacteria bacterium]|nr:6-phosphogluconolactonase [Candidatus Nomurabacteria bacterium]
MSIDIQTTTDPEVAAKFIASKILKQLEISNKVLWFVPGGSAITVAVEAAKIISHTYKHTYANTYNNLTVTLTDERFGRVGHKDSNWRELIERGFNLPEAKLLPVLNIYTERSRSMTTEKFNTIIGDELQKADYRIGLFGVGADGHTAGILPLSAAVSAKEWACSYQAPKFERVTITSKTIDKLDEAVVWAQGREKWRVIKDIIEKEIDLNLQPAQVLREVKRLTIFTDYIGGHKINQ